MGGALETATRTLFDNLDRKDAEAIIRTVADDVQAVDEISRQWLRGADALGAYFRQAMEMVDGIQSTINNVHESIHGDAGLLTCWLEQDYTLEGERTHVSAPTTLAFRREGNEWKVILIHTVPLAPPQDS